MTLKACHGYSNIKYLTYFIWYLTFFNKMSGLFAQHHQFGHGWVYAAAPWFQCYGKGTRRSN